MANTKLYDCIYNPTHHKASSDGMVYKHILVAEEMLCRPLEPGETVHHIDRNKKNNNPNNILVFCSNSAHARFHKHDCLTNTLILLPNGSYECAIGHEYATECPACGKRKYRKAKLCSNCRLIERRKNIPSCEALKMVLQNNSYNLSAVARQYDVSFTAVKKWCIGHGINYKNADVV